MKDTSQTIPFNTNNTIACKRFMEAKIDGILIIMGRKMRLIWLCFIVTPLITEAGVDIMYLLERCKDILEYFKVAEQ
ncbi:hypothetical protein [Phocaeicola sartorii]|uniref:hypothetical protein n=1 Tax=Phocaeicola sartorii TaxID=671267 RepID=UPI003516CDE5